MTPAPTEKAAPIPAEVLRRAEEVAVKWLGAEHEAVPFLANDIARAIMQDSADRASQEERTREDEREADMRELVILNEYDDFARQCDVASTARTKRLVTLRSRLRCGEKETSQ